MGNAWHAAPRPPSPIRNDNTIGPPLWRIDTPLPQSLTSARIGLAPSGRMAALLAVDLGVRTGLAAYGDDGRLRWYRSQNFGTAARLRRAVPGLLDVEQDVTRLVVEGGGPLLEPWAAEAAARGVTLQRVSAEAWRALFLLPREQRTGAGAKRTAAVLARRVIEWSGARRPTSLTHDAAEAILVGLWGVLGAGWLDRLPPQLLR